MPGIWTIIKDHPFRTFAIITVPVIGWALYEIPEEWKQNIFGVGKQWLLVLLLIWIVLFIVISFWKLLDWYLNPTNYRQRKDMVSLLAQMLGGAVIIFGLYSTWENLRIARENIEVVQKGQRTERFTKAIEQLAKSDPPATQVAAKSPANNNSPDQFGDDTIVAGVSNNLSIRLAGVYTLGQIENSQEYHLPVIKVLTNYVRINSTWNAGQPIEQQQVPDRIPADIQAILAVLGQRSTKLERDEVRMELSGAYLRRADLRQANFHRAILRYVCLMGADLRDADFSGADFWAAHFDDSVDLVGTTATNFESADFHNADLSRVSFGKSKLKGAVFSGAKLDGADLSKVEGLTRQQIKMAASHVDAKLPQNLPEH